MLPKTFFIALVVLLSFTLSGCSKSVYQFTVPVELTAERRAELEADIQKWGALITNAPALQQAVVDAAGDTLNELGDGVVGLVESDDITDFRPNFDFFVEKARALTRLGRVGEAIQVYDEALMLYEASSVGWHNLGRLYEQVGDYELAVEYYAKIIDSFELLQYRFDIARAWLAAGELEKAQAAYLLFEKETGGHNASFKQRLGL